MNKAKLSLTTKDIVLMGLMLASIEVVKSALSFIAGVEMVTLLFILYTLYFRKKMVYLLLCFYLTEGVLYGFGIWWFAYLYIWALLVWLVYLFRKRKSVWFWSVLSGLFGLSFGLLCSFMSLFAGGIKVAVSWWIAGIPTDILHGISNFVICLVLFKPLDRVFSRVKW